MACLLSSVLKLHAEFMWPIEIPSLDLLKYHLNNKYAFTVSESSPDGNDTNRVHPWSVILRKAVSNHSSREVSTEKNIRILPKLSACGWLRTCDISFPPVQLTWTTYKNYTNWMLLYISKSVSKVYLVRTRKYVCYLFIQTHRGVSHSDLSLAGIWGHLSEINLRFTEDQFFDLKINRD